MKITLLAVGKTSSGWVAQGIQQYVDRLKHYIQFEIVIIPDARKGDERVRRASECSAILEACRPDDHVILLDERGKQPTSVELSQELQTRMNSGLRRLVMVIGGPFGFTREVYARANALLGLSRLTLTHEMARLLLTEQLYRAMTILRGESYHHQ